MSENKRIRDSFTVMTVQWGTVTCFGLNFGRWRRTERSKSRMETFRAELDVSSEIRRHCRGNKSRHFSLFLWLFTTIQHKLMPLYRLLSSNVLMVIFIDQYLGWDSAERFAGCSEVCADSESAGFPRLRNTASMLRHLE